MGCHAAPDAGWNDGDGAKGEVAGSHYGGGSRSHECGDAGEDESSMHCFEGESVRWRGYQVGMLSWLLL